MVRTYDDEDGQENEGVGDEDDPGPGGQSDRLGRVLAFLHGAPVERMTNVSEHLEDDECVEVYPSRTRRENEAV